MLPEIGYKGQMRLRNAKIGIIGLGGLGSPAAYQLAALGIGHLRLVDRDVVELSNLHRQHLYGIGSLGFPKVEAAANRLHDLNPNIEIEPLPLSLNTDNAETIISDLDIVVDGLDRMAPRYAINRACQKLNIPYVFGAAIMTMGNVTTIIPNETPCLECFQGNLEDDTLPRCAVVGVHPSVLSIIASIEVSEAVRTILGQKPHLANRLLYCDMGNLEFLKVEIVRDENCPVCGTTPSAPPMPLKHKSISELCGRKGKRVFTITPRKNLQIDLDELHAVIHNLGFETTAKTNLGLTFNNGLTASILKSGIMIVEGAKSENEAWNFYTKMIIDELKITQEFVFFSAR